MQIVPASTPNLIRGFDCYEPISSDMANAAVTSGYVFAARYVDNLRSSEIATILGSGLALMLVKQAPNATHYTGPQGSADGDATVRLAEALEIPAGMCIFVDAENIQTSKSDAQAYLENWSLAVTGAGFVPGIYVGTTLFSAVELHRNFGFQHYWQAGTANIPFVDKRGYQLYQQGQATINDQTVDLDYAQADLLGGKLLWLTN